MINNLLVRSPRAAPLSVGMADHNEDDLNQFSRRTLSDLLHAAHIGTTQAYAEVGRPSADLVVPALSEFTLGQLMQMLMLATVVEAKLTGVNPYGNPAAGVRQRYAHTVLKGMGNPT